MRASPQGNGIRIAESRVARGYRELAAQFQAKAKAKEARSEETREDYARAAASG
jgi:hypothetical protein